MLQQIDDKKYQRQLQGVERWRYAKTNGVSHANGWGTLNWFTGVGKTFGGCIVINKLFESNSGSTVIIVVPNPTIKKQWEATIKARVNQSYHSNIRIYTVGEVLEIINNDERLICTLLVVDELHEFYSPERFQIFNGVNIITKYALGLTATFDDIHGRHKQMEAILPVVDCIDEEEASKEGYISKYIEYNVSVPLTDIELQKYKVLSDIISKSMAKFGHRGLDFITRILTGDKENKGIVYATMYAQEHGWRKNMDLTNPENYELHDMWSPQKIMGYAKLVMDNIRERKNLLYFSQNKLQTAKDVVIKFEDLVTICFSQSTSFADNLGKLINGYYLSIGKPAPCVVYHSQLETIIVKDSNGKEKKKGKTILKKEALEAIESGKARIISTASSLDKGLDISKIRLVLTTSGTQNPTQNRQRKGRGLRIEETDKDVIVLIINLYIPGTMDERWLRKRQSKSTNTVYWVGRVDDINYIPEIHESNDDVEI